MKGIIFTEFLELVETKFGLEVVDAIIEESAVESGGIYTSVGTYEFSEMVQLLSRLSEKVNTPVGDLLYVFGLYLFNSLGKAHPEVIRAYSDPIELLDSIEDHIHVHVKKLYPDAELPTFKILNKSDHSITMVYSSSRGLYRLAHGLIHKTFEHFNGSATITYELLKPDGTEVKFDIIQDE
ncbi:MAG: heme NO-binding domain-containing protein [Flavobacteriaceae bacterium]|nr:heme NO-binding domain-containing protein [Flavobacteriaceae bacterium]MDH3795408.1 heme NO-binding domain-containing protein [Flavobacteriaceae bacterium]